MKTILTILLVSLIYLTAYCQDAELTVNVQTCDGAAIGKVGLFVGTELFIEKALSNGSAKFTITGTGVNSISEKNELSISVTPNPVQDGFVSLSVKNFSGNHSKFNFYDLSGKLLGKIESEKENKLDLSTESGVILYEFISNNNSLKTGKIVLNSSSVQIQTVFEASSPVRSKLKSTTANDYTIKYFDESNNVLYTETVIILAGAVQTLDWNVCAGLTLIYNNENPMLEFAAQEIRDAYDKNGSGALTIKLSTELESSTPQAFDVETNSPNYIHIIGSDVSGTMYGGLHVAEYIQIGEDIVADNFEPFVPKRGIKFNIPLDVRNPSYDDSGDAAQENIKNMWDLEGFWKPYLDELARNRFNELSLWTCHEFPHMVDFSNSSWPNVNTTYANNVYRAKKDALDSKSNGKYIVTTWRTSKDPAKWEQGMLDWKEDLGRNGVYGDGFVDTELIERVDGKDGIPAFNNIQDKVNHWKAVFDYAETRGIEISIMHWNVYAHGAKGVDGIEESQDDDANFHPYLRYAVKQLILTYPQIKTIGVAAGENDDEDHNPKYSTEEFIYETYGKGVKDALAETPGRKVKFLWRNHSTEIEDVYNDFVKYYDPNKEGLVDVSIKYCVGRLYSSRRPMEWEKRAEGDGWLDPKDNFGYPWKVWYNIRNDDMFMHRFGSADYIRGFIKNLPLDVSPGFVLGSDGYVWGKEHITKNTGTVLENQLEIKKHWYNFALWGKLAYNNTLTDSYWIKVLAEKYGISVANASILFNAWEQVSEVTPQINQQSYTGTDAGFQVEGCMYRFNTTTGFLTFDRLFLNRDSPMTYARWPIQLKQVKVGDEKQCWPVRHWVDQGKADLLATTSDQIDPANVANKLDEFANAVLGGTLASLKGLNKDNIEYQDMLLDLESMAHLGRYYADKLRLAIAWYEFHNSNYNNTTLHNAAIAHAEAAEAHWVEYAAVLDQHYNPSLTARTHYLNWNGTLNAKNYYTATHANGGTPNLAPRGVKLETQWVKNNDSKLKLTTFPNDARWERDEGVRVTPPWLK